MSTRIIFLFGLLVASSWNEHLCSTLLKKLCFYSAPDGCRHPESTGVPSTTSDTIMLCGTSASPSGSSLHWPCSNALASSQSGHFVQISSKSAQVTTCIVLASSFSTWVHAQVVLFRRHLHTASSVFENDSSVVTSEDLSFTRTVLHSEPAFDRTEDILSFEQHLCFAVYVLTPSFQVD